MNDLIRFAAAQRLSDAVAEVRAAALDLATIEARMAPQHSTPTPSLDQPGSGVTTSGNVGADHARYTSERAAQDAKVDDLARRTVDRAAGGVPK